MSNLETHRSTLSSTGEFTLHASRRKEPESLELALDINEDLSIEYQQASSARRLLSSDTELNWSRVGVRGAVLAKHGGLEFSFVDSSVACVLVLAPSSSSGKFPGRNFSSISPGCPPAFSVDSWNLDPTRERAALPQNNRRVQVVGSRQPDSGRFLAAICPAPPSHTPAPSLTSNRSENSADIKSPNRDRGERRNVDEWS
ncbi:hypothetical protein B0H16DRAFT_1467620 [Mycena metata]|uniref:Uncharacterized protein n=1 Tax=Mycena metata TaxID=1033252 RepID=A0AAD7I3F2_9AGAR|nr:hypothetical protein B0H16DRAFT_1467620 [Mycena metata]